MKLETRIERLEAAAGGTVDEGREVIRLALQRLTIEELTILRALAEIENSGGGSEEWPEGAGEAIRAYERALPDSQD